MTTPLVPASSADPSALLLDFATYDMPRLDDALFAELAMPPREHSVSGLSAGDCAELFDYFSHAAPDAVRPPALTVAGGATALLQTRTPLATAAVTRTKRTAVGESKRAAAAAKRDEREVQLRRELNRQAAERCRNKRLALISALQEQVEKLRVDRDRLAFENELLRASFSVLGG